MKFYHRWQRVVHLKWQAHFIHFEKKCLASKSELCVLSKNYIPSGKAIGLAHIYTSVFVAITTYLDIQ